MEELSHNRFPLFLLSLCLLFILLFFSLAPKSPTIITNHHQPTHKNLSKQNPKKKNKIEHIRQSLTGWGCSPPFRQGLEAEYVGSLEVQADTTAVAANGSAEEDAPGGGTTDGKDKPPIDKKGLRARAKSLYEELSEQPPQDTRWNEYLVSRVFFSLPLREIFPDEICFAINKIKIGKNRIFEPLKVNHMKELVLVRTSLEIHRACEQRRRTMELHRVRSQTRTIFVGRKSCSTDLIFPILCFCLSSTLRHCVLFLNCFSKWFAIVVLG